MAVTQTHRGPIDTHAERATLAAGMWTHEWWAKVRAIVEPDDFGHVEHQQIARALDDLHDIGPLVPTCADWLEQWTGLWPITPPSSQTLRIAAIATITELNAGAIAGIFRYADARHNQHAHHVADLARQRHRILELKHELRDLTA